MLAEPPKYFSGALNSRVKLQDQIRCFPKCPLGSKILGAKIISYRKSPRILQEKREAEKKKNYEGWENRETKKKKKKE